MLWEDRHGGLCGGGTDSVAFVVGGQCGLCVGRTSSVIFVVGREAGTVWPLWWEDRRCGGRLVASNRADVRDHQSSRCGDVRNHSSSRCEEPLNEQV